MQNLQRAKTLGIIALVSFLFAPVPYLGIVIGLCGTVLMLLAYRYISKATGQPSIFRDYVKALVIAVIGGVLFGLVIFVYAFLYAFVGAPDYVIEETILHGPLVLLIVYFTLVGVAYFQSRAMRTAGEYLHNKWFQTAGKLMFWGAVLVIALGVGLLIMLIGSIVQAIAFFTMPTIYSEQFGVITDTSEATEI